MNDSPDESPSERAHGRNDGLETARGAVLGVLCGCALWVLVAAALVGIYCL